MWNDSVSIPVFVPVSVSWQAHNTALGLKWPLSIHICEEIPESEHSLSNKNVYMCLKAYSLIESNINDLDY